jgi:hypothetical protein
MSFRFSLGLFLLVRFVTPAVVRWEGLDFLKSNPPFCRSSESSPLPLIFTALSHLSNNRQYFGVGYMLKFVRGVAARHWTKIFLSS